MSENLNRLPRQDVIGSVRSAFSNLDAGYIGDEVFPPLSVFQTSGSRPMVIYNASGTAQTGRSPSGAITGTNNRSANLESFTCAEVISRQTIDVAQTPMFGGQAAQELALGVSGFREVRDKIELKAATALSCHYGYTSGSPTDGTSAIFDTILAAVDQLRPYGRVALVGAKSVFNIVRKDSTVADRMKAIGTPIMDLKDVKSIGSAVLAAIFGADECIEAVTPTALWSATRLAVIVKPNAAYDPMSFPQLGRRFVYTWQNQGVNETMSCEQSYDVSVRNDVLDFVTKDVIVKPTHGADFSVLIKIATE